MSSQFKDYHIGIDYGTSNSCVGIFMNGTVQIVPNKIGERTTPSIVCFSNENKDKAIVGEETLSQKLDNYKNTIYEVKRFIGLSYDEFIENGYDKNLNYDIVNQNGIPKIKVNVNNKDYFYSAEEISSFIIKKMVQCAEDFIDKYDQGIKLTKAIITVPAHFRDDQKDAVKSAAKLAGIEVPRVINEPTAAALAYGIGHNLVPENSISQGLQKKNTLLTNVGKHGNDLGEAPLVIDNNKSKSSESAIVFDLGGGTLDITLLNIRKNNEGVINFEVEVSDGDTHLGGSDFDNKLIDYCISEFCKTTPYKEENVRQDKKACKRLKIKCENAKKMLSLTKKTTITVENFFGTEDLIVEITRDFFNDLCKDLYDKIEELIIGVLDEIGKQTIDIDELILVGGATRMPGIKDLLRRLFGEAKVKDNLNPDEAVAFGATMEAAKMEEKDKINFILQDIIAYKLGIAVENPDPIDKEKNGLLMRHIIKRYSKIPSSSEKGFSSELTKMGDQIGIKIYEGNDQYVNKNTFLGEMYVNNINAKGNIDYKVKFSVDVNSQLTVTISIDSLGIKKEKIIKKVTHGFMDKENKKIKVCKIKQLKPISVLIDSIVASKQKLSQSVDSNIKLDNLNDCCKNLEDLVENYMVFLAENESVYEKVYINTKDLFGYYIDRLKLKGQGEKKIPDIIQKIKHHMKNLIASVAYVEDLLETISEIKEINELKNEFYEIFVNYMELMNEEGQSKKKNDKFSRYYSKLYFEKEFYSRKKYIKKDDILNMDNTIKGRYEKEKKINEEELKKVNSFTSFIEEKINKGEFIYGKTGFTVIGRKIDRYEKDIESMTLEEIKEVLDIFEGMVDSFDQKDNSVGEAYCLSHIIIINYKIFNRGYDKLWARINRLKTILFSIKKTYVWAEEAKKIMDILEEKKNG